MIEEWAGSLTVLAILAIAGGLVGWACRAVLARDEVARAVDTRDARIAELEAERTALQARTAEREQALDALRRKWEAESARLSGLERDLLDLRTRAGGASRPAAPVQHGPDAQVPDEGPVRKPQGLLTAPAGAPDDLTAIRGIGQKIQGTLNDLGIYHFRQIAALTPDEVRWLAGELGAFPGRISRENWIGQAQALAGPDAGGPADGA
ncbi:hypothetical protein [Futiania mangrovi]|uniref:Uncharacterized protein n=1 Tax=Futiania mangrovi TaxID=2959716 RepID=A0A9J6PEK1_9PROT|nr:hypothetical protein [Futiania mangrovii]MCP1336256.1 hypothetical protein [Futiania mangrovii]